MNLSNKLKSQQNYLYKAFFIFAGLPLPQILFRGTVYAASGKSWIRLISELFELIPFPRGEKKGFIYTPLSLLDLILSKIFMNKVNSPTHLCSKYFQIGKIYIFYLQQKNPINCQTTK
ncbi:hypothetical protein BpHYR1_030700 [Brachionus plicatilis]|uniref:Uncharacterized protein n=1 Tax=Brachionus plicatilis TaxID=10195 RepID=A0A3M7RU23_BRAPC|nr:hypothetical protein BpHYR1_030700 [Brachionus plicatilis]